MNKFGELTILQTLKAWTNAFVESLENYEGLNVKSEPMNVNGFEVKIIRATEVRTILEGQAARIAATYMSEEDLALLSECIHIGRTGTVEEIMNTNKKFHDLIVQASKNPMMIDIIDRMQSIIYLFRKTVVYHKRPFLIDEHQEIYDAIKQRDADKAEKLMPEHLQADLDFSIHVL